MAPKSLPPGFRFHPTDEELVAYYLHRKISGVTIELEVIPEVDLYKCEPWDLPDKSFLPNRDMEWYFYSPRNKKYPNGSRTNRATKAGYWKATGKDRLVHSHKKPVGMKKTLVYYRGRAPHGIRSNWVMHEYRLLQNVSSSIASTSLQDSYALCRVFKKAITVTKTKEEAPTMNIENVSTWISEDQISGQDADGIDTSCGREAEDENFNEGCYSKLPSDTSSSDVTQGTPAETCTADDMQALFTSDEANSSGNMYSIGMDYCSSSLIQDIQQMGSSLHYQFPYPPLELEDFPQINISEAIKGGTKPEIMHHLAMGNHPHDMNGTLEDIFSLCSSHFDHSVPL